MLKLLVHWASFWCFRGFSRYACGLKANAPPLPAPNLQTSSVVDAAALALGRVAEIILPGPLPPG